MSEKPKEIMSIALPVPEAADLATRAAIEGVPTEEYLGIQALAGAYGHAHPEVVAFKKRAKSGQGGPESRGGE